MRKLPISLLLFFLTVIICSQEATITEELITLPTYPYSDPDPVPKPGKIYPYFRFDAYSYEAADQEWNMLSLENEWIELWIAPELGGKIYGARDKITGNNFIYYNK